jgi:hypothetical protein
MSARTKLDQLAAARPALLDHTERVVDAELEERMLTQILCSARPAGAMTGPRARPGGLRSPRLVTAIAAGAAVAIAAAGVLAGTGAFRDGPAGRAAGQAGAAAGPVRVISATTLADRTVAAVNRSSRTDVFYSRTVFAGHTTETSTAALEEWDYGISVREKLFNAQGSLTDDVSAVVRHGMRDRRFVYYNEKTWDQDSIQVDHYGAPNGVRATVNALLDVNKPRTRSTGSRTVIKHVNVNGKQMLKVTLQWPSDQGGMSPLPLFTDSEVFPSATIGKPFTETVWIDQASYLPVRVVLTASGGRVLASETMAWLTPDQANLAELTPAPIPAGFREDTPPAH